MHPHQPSLKTRLAHAVFGDIIQTAVAEAHRHPIPVRVDDTPGWNRLAPAGPHDRDFAEWYQDQEDALEAWRKNFLVRRRNGCCRTNNRRYLRLASAKIISVPIVLVTWLAL
jgi:hypothetical protein